MLMNECVETDRLILHRHIFDDGMLYSQLNKKQQHSSPQALANLLKKNQNVIMHIFGWWIDVSSAYSAGMHISEDSKAWRHKEQLQYYIYEKETQKCIGIFCALIKNKEAYVLAWLSKDYQNKGYGKETAKALDKELFETLEIDKIKYECFTKNPNQKKVVSFLNAAQYQEEKSDKTSTLWVKTKEAYFSNFGVQPIFVKAKKASASIFNCFIKMFVRE